MLRSTGIFVRFCPALEWWFAGKPSPQRQDVRVLLLHLCHRLDSCPADFFILSLTVPQLWRRPARKKPSMFGHPTLYTHIYLYLYIVKTFNLWNSGEGSLYGSLCIRLQADAVTLNEPFIKKYVCSGEQDMDFAVLCLLPHHAADGQSLLSQVRQQDHEEGVRHPECRWNPADSHFNAASPLQVLFWRGLFSELKPYSSSSQKNIRMYGTVYFLLQWRIKFLQLTQLF